jgi:hypothetical protein
MPFPGGPDPASGMPPGFIGQPGFPGGPMSGPGSSGWGRPVGYRGASRPGRLIVAVILLIIVVVVLIARHSASPSSPSGPCVGGPVMGSAGQPLGNGNYRFTCADGGSTVVHLGGSGN